MIGGGRAGFPEDVHKQLRSAGWWSTGWTLDLQWAKPYAGSRLRVGCRPAIKLALPTKGNHSGTGLA